jgi:2OG-Fe(II) oxygenase superfamily
LADPASLHFRRLHELFCCDEDDEDDEDQQDQDQDDTTAEEEEEEAEAEQQEQDDSAAAFFLASSSEAASLLATTTTTTGSARSTPTPQPPPKPTAATATATTVLRINQLTLVRIHWSPNIYLIENFLSPTELSHLLKLISADKNNDNIHHDQHHDHRPHQKKKKKALTFERSYVGDDSHVDPAQRTSTFLNLSKQHDKIIAGVETKAASLLGCFSTTTIEPLQLVRYRPGQFFGVHHDLGDYDDETHRVLLPDKSWYYRRRLVTIFCYLNTLKAATVDDNIAASIDVTGAVGGGGGGGATEFPALGLAVTPRAGTAVVFPNVLVPSGQPDVRTIHAGLPPTNTIKYGLNIWICED